MAELKIRDGDYQRRGSGLAKVDGTEALLQRVLFKLTARRGAFPFVESLGSRLWQQYAAEALRDEGLTVEDVTLQERPDGTVAMTAALRGDGRQALSVTVDIR